MTSREKNKRRRKRALIGAVSTASLIVIGTTFAWFTSKDEVTNRLTASANYGVSIAEDFTPPEDWTPGQEINKDVSAVNTGNVDAFVRLRLAHAITGTALDPAGVAIAKPISEKALKIDTSKTNWRETYQTGELVVLAGAAVKDTTAINVDGSAQVAGDGIDDAVYRDSAVLVNSKSFTASEDGLYIFRRQITNDGTNTKYSFSGYYKAGVDYYKLLTVVEADGSVTVDIKGLQDVTNAVPTTSQIDAVKLAAKKDLPAVTASNTTAILDSTNNLIKVTYAGADGALGNPADTGEEKSKAADNITINVKLDADYATNWSYLADLTDDRKNVNGNFYLNSILSSGETSAKLVDAVELDGSVTSAAYLDLAYDLTVALDSIQVTPDEAKTDASYVAGVNSAWTPVTATKIGNTISWTANP